MRANGLGYGRVIDAKGEEMGADDATDQAKITLLLYVSLHHHHCSKSILGPLFKKNLQPHAMLLSSRAASNTPKSPLCSYGTANAATGEAMVRQSPSRCYSRMVVIQYRRGLCI